MLHYVWCVLAFSTETFDNVIFFGNCIRITCACYFNERKDVWGSAMFRLLYIKIPIPKYVLSIHTPCIIWQNMLRFKANVVSEVPTPLALCNFISREQKNSQNYGSESNHLLERVRQLFCQISLRSAYPIAVSGGTPGERVWRANLSAPPMGVLVSRQASVTGEKSTDSVGGVSDLTT